MRKKIIHSVSLAVMLLAVPTVTDASSKVDNLIEISNKYKGVPYSWGGTTPNGFDCSGYTQYVFKKAGITLPRTSDQQYNIGTPVSKSNLEKGDLVFFSTYRSGPSHNGIYIGDGKFIHSSTSSGVIISSINDPFYWGARYIGARKVLKEPKQVEVKVPVKKEVYNEGYWAYSYIERLKELQIIEKDFSPNKSITEGQAMTMFKNALLKMNRSEIELTNSNVVSYMINKNVIDSSNSLNSNKLLTRAEAVKKIVGVLGEFDEQSKKQQAVSFNDFSRSHEGYQEVAYAINEKMITGYNDGSFKPDTEMKQSEFAVLLYRALELL
ncbi:C40 family peptidase [Bacillus solimangrovi]|nr:C40 family peptidase [Bacillus solimangrovi]